MYIAVLRGDVVVAQHGNAGVRSQFPFQPGREGCEPVQFVPVLVRIDALAVGHIGADQAHAADVGADYPALRVIEAGDTADDIGGRLPAENGDAVIGLLARERGRVARRLEFGLGKTGILELEFLQAQRIRLVFAQPVQNLRQAYLERVDVPRCYAHLQCISLYCKYIMAFSRAGPGSVWRGRKADSSVRIGRRIDFASGRFSRARAQRSSHFEASGKRPSPACCSHARLPSKSRCLPAVSWSVRERRLPSFRLMPVKLAPLRTC